MANWQIFKEKNIVPSLFLFLVLATALSHSQLINIFSVKPNLVLQVVVVAILILNSRFWFFVLTLMASAGLSFASGLGLVSLSFFISSLVGYWLSKRFLGGGVLGAVVLAIIITFLNYLILDYSFLLNFSQFFLELVYNIIGSVALLELISVIFYEKEVGPTV